MTTINWAAISRLMPERSDAEIRQLADAELVKQLLIYCSLCPGAKITISVEHNNGAKALLEAYDHAALVQGLSDAIEYFQSENA